MIISAHATCVVFLADVVMRPAALKSRSRTVVDAGAPGRTQAALAMLRNNRAPCVLQKAVFFTSPTLAREMPEIGENSLISWFALSRRLGQEGPGLVVLSNKPRLAYLFALSYACFVPALLNDKDICTRASSLPFPLQAVRPSFPPGCCRILALRER